MLKSEDLNLEESLHMHPEDDVMDALPVAMGIKPSFPDARYYSQNYAWKQKVLFHPQPMFVNFEVKEHVYQEHDDSYSVLIQVEATIKPDRVCFMSHHRVLHSLVEFEVGTHKDHIDNIPHSNAIQIEGTGSNIEHMISLKKTSGDAREFFIQTQEDKVPDDTWTVRYSDKGVADFYVSHPERFDVHKTALDKLPVQKNQTHLHEWVYDRKSASNGNFTVRSSVLYHVDRGVDRVYLPIGFSAKWYGYQIHASKPAVSISQWKDSVIVDLRLSEYMERIVEKGETFSTLKYNPPHIIAQRGLSREIDMKCY